MKPSTISSSHNPSQLRQDAQSVLKEGETLSSFAAEALRKQIESRKFQQEFIERGLAVRDTAKATGNYVSKTDVMASLEQLLHSVTSGNIHDEIEAGEAVGKEIL